MRGSAIDKIDTFSPRSRNSRASIFGEGEDSSPSHIAFSELKLLGPFERFEGGGVDIISSTDPRKKLGFHQGGASDVRVETDSPIRRAKAKAGALGTFTESLLAKTSVPNYTAPKDETAPKSILRVKGKGYDADSMTASSSRAPPLNAMINKEKNLNGLRGAEHTEDELAKLLEDVATKEVLPVDKVNHRYAYRSKIYEGNARWVRDNVLGLVLTFDVENKIKLVKQGNIPEPPAGQVAKTNPIIHFNSYTKYLQEWQQLLVCEMCAAIERAASRQDSIQEVHPAAVYAERSPVDGIMEFKCEYDDPAHQPERSLAWQILLITFTDPGNLDNPPQTTYDLLTRTAGGDSQFQIAVTIPSIDGVTYCQGCAGGPVLKHFQKDAFVPALRQLNGLCVFVTKLCSLEALILQVEALGQIKSLASFDHILNPNADAPEVSAGDDEDFKNKISVWLGRCQLHESQKHFIQQTCYVANQGPPFVLLKGSPGSGKTTAMIHAVNCWKVSRTHQLHTKLISDFDVNALDKDELRIPRVLICSPNSDTIDHIERCIKQFGFTDGSGNKYWPHITRVGDNIPAPSIDIAASKRIENLRKANPEELRARRDEIKQRLDFLREGMRIAQRKLAILQKSMRDFPDGLPHGWEVRVQTREDQFELEDGHVTTQTVASAYYVDHSKQATQLHRPEQPGEDDPKGHILTNLPEFHSYANELIPMWSEYCHIKGEYAVIDKFLSQDYKTTKADLMAQILNHTHIVLATLDKSAMDVVKASFPYDVCVFEDAASVPETSILVPVKASRAWTIILVGDPTVRIPTPTTTFIRNRVQWDYPMIERLWKSINLPKFELKQQYRSHPDIVRFTSTLFPNPSDEQAKNEDMFRVSKNLKVMGKNRFAFWNVDNGQQESLVWDRKITWFNRHEADWVAATVAYIRKYTSNTSIALLSDYRAQGDAIYQRVKQFGGVSTFPVEEFNQQEADIVIVSCTRTVPRTNNTVGFGEDRLLTHTPTLHLALTRAKQYVIVFGHADAVVSYGQHWTNLVELTKSEGCFRTVGHAAPSNEGVMKCVGVEASDLPKSPRSPADGQPQQDTEMGNGEGDGGPRKKARTS